MSDFDDVDFHCSDSTDAAKCAQLVRESIRVWSNVVTFADLKRTARNSCLGKYFSPFYGPLLYDGDIQASGDNPQMTNDYSSMFADIQSLGFITFDSQFEEYDENARYGAHMGRKAGAKFTSFQKAYVVGLMPKVLAERVCGMFNTWPNFVAFRVEQQRDVPSEYMNPRLYLGVTGAKGDHELSTNLRAMNNGVPEELYRWCPRIWNIVDEHKLVYVTIVNTDYKAPIGTLLRTLREALAFLHKKRIGVIE